IANTRQILTVLPEAERHQDQFTHIYSLAWESPIRDNLFVKVAGGFQRINIDVYPELCNTNSNSNCYNLVSITDRITGLTSQNDSQLRFNVRDSYRFSADASYFPGGKLAGTHELKTGARLTYGNVDRTTNAPGGMTLTTQNGLPFQRALACYDFND